MLILSTLMTEVAYSSETLVPTRATRCHILEDGNLHVASFPRLWEFALELILSTVIRVIFSDPLQESFIRVLMFMSV
jgi:hypothetical protein